MKKRALSGALAGGLLVGMLITSTTASSASTELENKLVVENSNRFTDIEALPEKSVLVVVDMNSFDRYIVSGANAINIDTLDHVVIPAHYDVEQNIFCTNIPTIAEDDNGCLYIEDGQYLYRVSD